MRKEKLIMKYEKPEVEKILTDEEDIIRTSSNLEIDETSDDYNWSGFF